MIAAAMEMRRMGLSAKKYVCRSKQHSWSMEKHFLRYVSERQYSLCRAEELCPAKRESVLERIRDEEFDGIIIAYSCFEQIPLSNE